MSYRWSNNAESSDQNGWCCLIAGNHHGDEVGCHADNGDQADGLKHSNTLESSSESTIVWSGHYDKDEVE
jgi:hypothetical protein